MTDSRDRVDVSALVSAWEQLNTADRASPHELLFPHLERLRDSDVQAFYDGLRERGYQGEVRGTVKEVASPNALNLPVYHLGQPLVPLTRANLYYAVLSPDSKG